MAEHFHHSLLDAFVSNGLFSLILIGSDAGKRGDHQDQAILYVRKGDFAFVFIIFPRLLQIRVDLVNKRIANRLIRSAAVFQPTGIVIIFRDMPFIRKGKRYVNFCPVFRFVFPILHLALCLPKLDGSQAIFPSHFLNMILNAVFIIEGGLFKCIALLVAK